MPGDTGQVWERCKDCGTRRPPSALVDGECVDRMFCAETQNRSISETADAQETIVRLTAERDALQAQFDDAMRHLADAREEVEEWESLDCAGGGPVAVAIQQEREACARLVLGLHVPMSLDDAADAIRARGAVVGVKIDEYAYASEVKP